MRAGAQHAYHKNAAGGVGQLLLPQRAMILSGAGFGPVGHCSRGCDVRVGGCMRAVEGAACRGYCEGLVHFAGEWRAGSEKQEATKRQPVHTCKEQGGKARVADSHAAPPSIHCEPPREVPLFLLMCNEIEI